MISKNALYIFAAVVVAMNAAGFYYLDQKINKRLGQIPNIAVVDLTKLASSYPQGATPQEVDALMVQTNNGIMKLKDAGYLVIDAGAVLAAPQDIVVDQELFK